MQPRPALSAGCRKAAAILLGLTLAGLLLTAFYKGFLTLSHF